MKSYFKKAIAVVLMVVFTICCFTGCKNSSLKNTRWYIDDVNKVARSVVSFEKDGVLRVNYLLLDKEKATRMGMEQLPYRESVSYYKDLGDRLEGEIAKNATDTCAYIEYETKEDLKEDKNGMVFYYHISKDGLVMGEDTYSFVNKHMGEEMDKEIQENLSASLN